VKHPNCLSPHLHATNWLSSLADAGMLNDTKVGRDRLFINREYLELLTRRES